MATNNNQLQTQPSEGPIARQLVKIESNSGQAQTQSNGQRPQKTKTDRLGISGKTLWDWVNLLGVALLPVMIGVFTLVSNMQQNQISQRQHDSDIQISQQQYDRDKQIALSQQRETTLKTSMDDIKDLLFNHKLRISMPGDEVRVIARAEVLAALRQLDGERKKLLVQFLSEAQLVTGIANKARGSDVIISLNGADLSNAQLFGAFLSGANLDSANLSSADLRGANLRGANLHSANLSKADFRGANLIGAILAGAIVVGADLSIVTLISCSGNECTGLNPETTVCSLGAYTVQTVVFSNAFVDLRYSPTCQTNWGDVNSRIGANFLSIRIQRIDGLTYTFSGGNFTIAWSAMVYAPMMKVRACGGVQVIEGCTAYI